VVRLVRLMRLGDVATVRQGISRHGRGAGARAGDWQVRVVTASDIQDDRLMLDGAATAGLEQSERAERYLVEPGDVLLTARSNSVKAALAPPAATRTLADAGLLIVRGSELFVPLGPYLWWYFTSATGRPRVRALMRGQTILSLSPFELAEMTVPLPPDDELYGIADLVEASEAAHVAAVEAAWLRRTVIRDAVVERLQRAAEQHGGAS
jgi:hypothetical protein